MENLGWIKLHRAILDSRIWASPEGLKIWMWILLKAHHSDTPLFCELKTGKGKTTVQIFQGQFIFGRNVAAKELKMTPRVVYNWIQKLASPEYDMILVQPKTHFSIIQIKNWRMYQVEKGTTKVQPMYNQSTHTRMDKNGIMDNKSDSLIPGTQAEKEEIKSIDHIRTDSINSVVPTELSHSVPGNIPVNLTQDLIQNVIIEKDLDPKQTFDIQANPLMTFDSRLDIELDPIDIEFTQRYEEFDS